MRQEKYGIGTRHKTNEGYEIEIIEKLNNDKRKVRFENGYEAIIDHSNISRGNIKNPYHPSVFGVGYFGVGDYKCSANDKRTKEYIVWTSMFKRCYDGKSQEKNPTYKNVTVCKEWYNFQNFARWYEISCPRINNINFQLDKDLLQNDVENKTYSPDTCVFIPNGVNLFLANKRLSNTSGYTGVSWDKTKKKWIAQISLFEEGKYKNLGLFPTPKLASKAYQKARVEQSEKVKEYLRSLNYLPEHIIQLIK